jgi:hypothetical protein
VKRLNSVWSEISALEFLLAFCVDGSQGTHCVKYGPRERPGSSRLINTSEFTNWERARYWIIRHSGDTSAGDYADQV